MLTSDYTLARPVKRGKVGGILIPEDDDDGPGVDPCPDQNETGLPTTGLDVAEWNPLPFVKDCAKWRYKMYPFGCLPLQETHPVVGVPQLAARAGQDYYGCLHAATHGVELRASPPGGKWNDMSFVFTVPFYYHPDMNDGYLCIDVGVAHPAQGTTDPDRLGYDKVTDLYGTADGVYRRAISNRFMNTVRVYNEDGTAFRDIFNSPTNTLGLTRIHRALIPRGWFTRGMDVYKFYIGVNRTNALFGQDTMQTYLTYFRTMMREEATMVAYEPTVTTLSHTILPRDQIADYRMGGQQPIENNSCASVWVKNTGSLTSYTNWPTAWNFGTGNFDIAVGFQGDGQIVPVTDGFQPSTPNLDINDSWMYHMTFKNVPETILVGHTNNGTLHHSCTHFYFLRDRRDGPLAWNMLDLENVECSDYLKPKVYQPGATFLNTFPYP